MDKETHPSFGVITISRVNGNDYLFDSLMKHHSYIRLCISPAEIRNSDIGVQYIGPSASSLIEINMSESQFARAITAFGHADGTPCTITRLHGEILERPTIKDVKKSYRDALQKTVEKSLEGFDRLSRMVADFIGRKERPTLAQTREVFKVISLVKQQLTDKAPFIHSMFEEAMENVVADAKTDIEGHINCIVQKLGIDSLASLPILEDPNPKEE